MTNYLSYQLIDGIKCYSPEVAADFIAYPDGGFEVTDQNAGDSFWVRSRCRLFKYLIQNYVPQEKVKFLEIGCATGDFIQYLSEIDNLEITGSEIYLSGLIYAKKTLPDVDFIQYDVTKGLIGDDFDMTVAFDVIEHIPDDLLALSNIYSMLSAGGIFIVSVPQHKFLWSKLDQIVKHQRRYSRKELLSKLNKCNFEIEYVTSFVFCLFPLMFISRFLDKGQNEGEQDKLELEKRVSFSKVLNGAFDFFMRIDEILIKMGVSLPFGGTLVVVCRKP